MPDRTKDAPELLVPQDREFVVTGFAFYGLPGIVERAEPCQVEKEEWPHSKSTAGNANKN
jgi:hypothetical protein